MPCTSSDPARHYRLEARVLASRAGERAIGHVRDNFFAAWKSLKWMILTPRGRGLVLWGEAAERPCREGMSHPVATVFTKAAERGESVGSLTVEKTRPPF